jgi:inward rectifier potassium channel
MARSNAPPEPARPRIVRRGLKRRPISDLYHFLINTSWPRLIALLIVVYLSTNAVFAAAYLAAGDAIENARPGSFVDAFFFSVQTMATIGYGKMVPRNTLADVLVTVEAFTGTLEVAMVTGLLFAKFSRPTARVLWSRVAVVSARDGVPSLMFRMANERGNQIVEAQLHLVLARNERTLEGEQVRRFYDLPLVRDRNATFAFTWTAVHPITPVSALYGATAEALAAQQAEVIASIIGIDETFAQTVHARHSYGADSIAFGARFVDILLTDADGQRYIEYTRFHDVLQVAKE